MIYIIKQKTLQCYRENKCLVLVGRTNSLYTGKDFHQNQTSWMGRNLLRLVSQGLETEDRKRSMEKQWTITRTKHRMQKAKLTYLSLEDCTVHCNSSIVVGWGFGSAAGEGWSRGFRGSTRRGWYICQPSSNHDSPILHSNMQGPQCVYVEKLEHGLPE